MKGNEKLIKRLLYLQFNEKKDRILDNIKLFLSLPLQKVPLLTRTRHFTAKKVVTVLQLSEKKKENKYLYDLKAL